MFCFYRCEEGENYVYTGLQCTEKREKLIWDSKYIIAAACGSGAFIILTAFVCCIICRRRGTKDKLVKQSVM